MYLLQRYLLQVTYFKGIVLSVCLQARSVLYDQHDQMLLKVMENYGSPTTTQNWLVADCFKACFKDPGFVAIRRRLRD